ncbi:hypothetical protein MIMGU_mgv1a016973mg [Erythranthe guttata]|uniref:Uncharacterized protein n=1 Tax=Erythranthe guttata TaxID=4155 RepID=A0A022PVQ3_ERYGU|nr:hypothetical protein MIMGU_mgv1a016973mg [Erythranthe guttata]
MDSIRHGGKKQKHYKSIIDYTCGRYVDFIHIVLSSIILILAVRLFVAGFFSRNFVTCRSILLIRFFVSDSPSCNFEFFMPSPDSEPAISIAFSPIDLKP